jgi:Ca2+-binding EF-hand superfamily protein
MSIKLSQFENTGITKKINFVNGQIEVMQPNKLDGEVQFFDIQERIEEINNIIQSLKGKESKEEITYKLLPVITDVEDDITYDRFLNMMAKPSTEFSFFLDALVETINDLFTRAENMQNIKNNVESISKKVPNLQIQETPEEELERLMGELPKINNKEIRKKIFRRVAELNNLIGE